jgi:hypothetical protein
VKIGSIIFVLYDINEFLLVRLVLLIALGKTAYIKSPQKVIKEFS